MSAVKKIMIALGFVKKHEHFHLTVVKGTGESGRAIVVKFPILTNPKKENIRPKDFETLVIDITH